jgi:ribonuclease HI
MMSADMKVISTSPRGRAQFPAVLCAPAAAPLASALMALPHVELFTDGACSGNPGPGGWAYVLRHPATGKTREGCGAEPDTTNNRMELQAVIQGLSALTRSSRVDLTSDSKYVLDGLKQWLAGWKRRGWKTADRKPVKNQDLWMALDELMGKHEVSFHWIRGHAGHAENERCDQLAVAAIEALRSGGRVGKRA